MGDTTGLELLEHFRINASQTQDIPLRRNQEAWIRDDIPLGSGSFGIVYLERSNRSTKTRAVKEVIKQRGIDYRKELLAITRLSRPAYTEHFAEFLGWYEDRVTVSFVMEYFELGDLRRHMTEPIPEPDAQDIAFQLLSGLEVMHADGFTHRDLKPENIFVAQKSPYWNVKIGDFGVTKRVQHNETALRTQVGTTAYIAPEVLELLDDESYSLEYTNAADIWATGVVVYEIMCAQKPFASSRVLRSYCLRKFEFPDPPPFSQGVSAVAMNLLHQLLQPIPSDRPSAVAARSSTWFRSGACNRISIDIQNAATVISTTDKFLKDKESSRSKAQKEAIKPLPAPSGSILKPQTTTRPLASVPVRSTLKTQAARQPSPTPERAESNIPSAPAPKNKTTDVHRAVANGEIAVLDNLRKLGRDVMAPDEYGKLPIQRAVLNGHIAMVDYLHKLGQGLEVKDVRGETLMHLAAKRGDLAMVERLRKLGQDIDVRNDLGELPIHDAAGHGQLAMVEHFYKLGQDRGAKSYKGWTPMHTAVSMGQLDMVDHLYKLGEDFDVKTYNGSTPMHMAALFGKLAMVDHLYKLGQSVEIRNHNGLTPTQLAAKRGYLAVADHLRKLERRSREATKTISGS